MVDAAVEEIWCFAVALGVPCSDFPSPPYHLQKCWRGVHPPWVFLPTLYEVRASKNDRASQLSWKEARSR